MLEVHAELTIAQQGFKKHQFIQPFLCISDENKEKRQCQSKPNEHPFPRNKGKITKEIKIITKTFVHIAEQL